MVKYYHIFLEQLYTLFVMYACILYAINFCRYLFYHLCISHCHIGTFCFMSPTSIDIKHQLLRDCSVNPINLLVNS